MDYTKQIGPISGTIIKNIKNILTAPQIKKKIKKEIVTPLLYNILEVLSPFLFIYMTLIIIILISLIIILCLTININKKISYMSSL